MRLNLRIIDHIVPHYLLLIESFDKPESVQKDGCETKLNLLDAEYPKSQAQRAEGQMRQKKNQGLCNICPPKRKSS